MKRVLWITVIWIVVTAIAAVSVFYAGRHQHDQMLGVLGVVGISMVGLIVLLMAWLFFDFLWRKIKR
ncbi:MAG: hypothetical protein QM762_15075 [Chryseolinea sp.]